MKQSPYTHAHTHTHTFHTQNTPSTQFRLQKIPHQINKRTNTQFPEYIQCPKRSILFFFKIYTYISLIRNRDFFQDVFLSTCIIKFLNRFYTYFNNQLELINTSCRCEAPGLKNPNFFRKGDSYLHLKFVMFLRHDITTNYSFN